MLKQDRLPLRERGSGDTTLVMMPFLGGSQREWSSVVEVLAPGFRCVTIDLPGFGEASDLYGYSVEEMCSALTHTLATLRIDRYFLVGHSMAGKVSAVTARQLVEDGSATHPPSGLVLVAPSPPSPETMPETKREQMLGYFESPSNLQRDAAQFIRENLAGPIPDELFDRAVEDVLTMNHEAWVAWLTRGSKEDWAKFVGVLDLPVLIVAGSEDKALGPATQKAVTAPHFRNSQMATLKCSHLIPLEKPLELADLIAAFIIRLAGEGDLVAKGVA